MGEQKIDRTETFHIELVATNPLNAPLIISDVGLSTSPAEGLDISSVPEISLEPYESQTVLIPVVASKISTVTIDTVNFGFNRFFPCSQSLERQGKRLHATKAQRISPTYGKDSSLTVEVGRSRPRIQLELLDVPEEVFEGEQVEVSLRVKNSGKVAVDALQLGFSEMLIRRKDSEYICTSSDWAKNSPAFEYIGNTEYNASQHPYFVTALSPPARRDNFDTFDPIIDPRRTGRFAWARCIF